MRILVYNSSWSNVGNGWFATSCRNLLRGMYPDSIVQDGDDDIIAACLITLLAILISCDLNKRE